MNYSDLDYNLVLNCSLILPKLPASATSMNVSVLIGATAENCISSTLQYRPVYCVVTEVNISQLQAYSNQS